MKFGGQRLAGLKRITEPYVLLCEGQHDSEFFTHLIGIHGLPKFEVCSVNYVMNGNHGGNSRFRDALDALVAKPGFQQVQKILIAADSDFPAPPGASPRNSFTDVVAQIDSTAPIIGPPRSKFAAPAAPLQKAGSNPSVVVLMVPWPGTPGNLDTMCLTAARNHSNSAFVSCVDSFSQCVGADQWASESARTKMKLRCHLSASWKDDPAISPTYVWSKNTNLVPLTDPVFSSIVGFLRDFPNL